MSFDQSTRSLKMRGLGPDDNFLLTSLSGREAISKLFSFQIEFLSTNLALTAKDVIAKPITLEVAEKNVGDRGDADQRFFHGYIYRFSSGSIAETNSDSKTPSRIYTAEVVPWLWFLTQTAQSHIFFPSKSDKTIYDVIEEVLNRPTHTKNNWEFRDASDLKDFKVEHCVQYRETDFNFISRLLEQYGAYYYFEHSDGDHKLVITTKPTSSVCKGKKFKLQSNKSEAIQSWLHSFEFASGQYEHSDFNFETPLDDLSGNSTKISELVTSSADYAVYDHPGEFSDQGTAKSVARIRQEEEETAHSLVQGRGGVRHFTSGHKFELAEHPDENSKDELGEYLLTAVQHFATEPFLDGETGLSYTNSFSCIPSSVRYRPPRLTPKPIISGAQTATVTGPAGQEIYTDKYGRIKVHFHWDRETRKSKSQSGENCSCWVRVAQAMAGRKYGFMAIPRINHEVVIEFIEGDPDRPICVGSVYNADQPPHYDPETHSTRTYLKTNSSPGGQGFNELFFEDKAGDERVFIHAEKNYDRRVKNSSTETIGGNVNLTVGHEDAEYGGEVAIDIEKKLMRSVGLDGIEFTNEGDEKRHTEGSHHLTVDGDWNSAADSISVDASRDINAKAGMNYGMEAGMNFHIKAGTALVIESGTQLTLKVGGNAVVIDPSGVSITSSAMVNINGSLVKVNSGPGSPAGSGAGCSVQKPDQPEKATPAAAHREQSGQKSC
ncbi:MAG: type VI secretion system tip protein VgrG [Planctomycetaceae bacterium]|nr:type VI secretion system tip protein VgrG [Planctomycetaceae bacterium]MCP4773975.1 type VI secretion system tip protein VgrG [Planctomycetaceae bacterium]